MGLEHERGKRYRNDPALFAREVLGVDWWAKQVEIAESARDNARVAVKACHASGKTRISADIALWYLSTHYPAIVITTAPTDRQVSELLWREMRLDHRNARFPLGGRFYEIPKWNLDDNWYALGFATKDANAFQGHHSEHILVIVDEAAGVPEFIFEAIEGIISTGDAKLLLQGQPTSSGGTFYDAFHAQRHRYKCVSISAFDTPNFGPQGMVRPYLVTPQWVEERRDDWGENSPLWYARVLGEFSPVATDTLIPLAEIVAAQQRWHAMKPDLPSEFGVDVARYGDDESVIAPHLGDKVMPLIAFHGLDTMQTTGRVVQEFVQYRPTLIKVDTVGIGAGVADRLKEQKYHVVEVESGAKARDPSRYKNLRAEMWDGLAARFHEGRIGLPPDDILAGQLATAKRTYISTGQMQMESKDDLKKRVGYSPDRADAVVYAFADLRGTGLVAVEQDTAESRWGKLEGGSRWRR